MRLLEEGYSISYLHKCYGINETDLQILWSKYQSKGPSGLLKITQSHPAFDIRRKVVSYIEQNCLTLSADSLKYDIKQHKDLKGLVMHSDQGWHYQHIRYQQMLKSKGIVQSMSRKGNCLDNAMMENFFRLMKNELLYIKQFSSIEQFEVE